MAEMAQMAESAKWRKCQNGAYIPVEGAQERPDAVGLFRNVDNDGKVGAFEDPAEFDTVQRVLCRQLQTPPPTFS